MSPDDVVGRIESALGERLLDLTQPNDRRIYLEVDAASVHDATRLLYDDLGARLQTASGVDGPEKMEILYHWALDTSSLVVSVRTHVDRNHPEIASIVAICPAAEWIEREMWELLGVSIQDHPDLRHLLLQDDWPEGKYPLRRDYRKD